MIYNIIVVISIMFIIGVYVIILTIMIMLMVSIIIIIVIIINTFSFFFLLQSRVEDSGASPLFWGRFTPYAVRACSGRTPLIRDFKDIVYPFLILVRAVFSCSAIRSMFIMSEHAPSGHCRLRQQQVWGTKH